MAVPRINWIDRTPATLLKWSSICIVIPVFIVFWIGFIVLTFSRFHEVGLAARMDLVAEVLSNSASTPMAAKTTAAAILDKAKHGGRTGVKLEWQLNISTVPTRPSPKDSSQLDAEFIEAAAEVISLESENPAFVGSYKRLGEASKRLSDAPLYHRHLANGSDTPRPSLPERIFQSYYIFEGVNFRMPNDVAEARKSAKLYLKHRDGDRGGQFDWIFLLRPWTALRFYDPKRVLLNDMLPFLVAELVLVAGFFLRYRYYDTEFHNPKEIRQRAAKWFPLWKNAVAPKTWQSLQFGRSWVVYIGVAVLACEAIELMQNDPEIASERWINIPMMGIVGASLTSGVLALMSIAHSEFSQAFLERSRALKGRVLRPFLIAAVGLIALSVFVGYFSFDQLICRGNPEMKERGIIQLIVSIILILLVARAIFFCIRAVTFGAENNQQKRTEEIQFNSPEPPWCINFFTDKVDEKFIIAITSIIIPIKVVWAVVMA